MNLLFVIPYVPSLVRVRSYQIIRHLKQRGHHITLATVWVNEAERSELDQFAPYYDELIAHPLPGVRSLVNCALALPTALPLQAVYSWSEALWRDITQRLARQPAIAAIHVEHLRGSQYAVRLHERANTPPVAWDSVDCISHLFKQASAKSRPGLKRRITQFDLQRTAKREGWLASYFRQVLVTSPNDKAALEKLTAPGAPPPNIAVIPNGVDLAYFQPGEAAQRQPATLVVSGKMSYHANVSMVLFLVNQVMPLVWQRRPDVRLDVVGKDPGPELQALASNPAIRVTGSVPSFLPYLQSATAAVAPIQYGAGIQNKVLEAMACATPVIASSTATSALAVSDGTEVLHANTPSEWAARILELLASPEQQRQLGAAGRRYVETHHQWPQIAGRLEEIYTSLAHDHHTH
jgi:sugar transferase (PEP-CTERM/EpsH1 system associated)